jgi:hypothetical protein
MPSMFIFPAAIARGRVCTSVPFTRNVSASAVARAVSVFVALPLASGDLTAADSVHGIKVCTSEPARWRIMNFPSCLTMKYR